MQLSDTHKAEFLALKPEDITKTFMINNFANRAKKVNGKIVKTNAKYKPTDTFYLTPSEYFVNESIGSSKATSRLKGTSEGIFEVSSKS